MPRSAARRAAVGMQVRYENDLTEASMFSLCQRSYVPLMTSAVEHADIKFVVYPVHMDGTLTGARPRMRHDPDCGHFKWGDGTVLGTAVLATEEQMRSLRACKSCIRSHRSAGDV
jgi:hypothetical protein